MDLQSTLGTANQNLKSMMRNMTDEMQTCISNCIQCHQLCESMIQHCLSKGGMHAEASHIKLLQDCAQICQVSADFMIRGSDHHMNTCQICSEVCVRCAEDCERMNDDEMMQMCVDACRRCADSCLKMAKQH